MRLSSLLSMMGLAAGLAAPALAQSPWSGQVTPYLWAAGLGGDLTPYQGAPSLSFSRSVSEVLEDLDSAFFLSGYDRRDSFVILGDLSASTSSRAGTVPPGLPAEGRLRQRSATLAAGWRAVAEPGGTLDLLAGARIWDLEARVAVAGGAVSAARSENFVDPILAVRANIALGARWSAILYADLGGMEVGSRWTDQVVVTVNYQVTERLYASLGYRRLDVDYRAGGTRVDATMAGPLLGLTWRF